VVRRIPHLLTAAIVVGCAAAVPSAALASASGKGHHAKGASGCISAVCVYKEHVQGAGGVHVVGTPTGSDQTKSSPLPSKVARKLQAQGGRDKALLTQLATNPGYGYTRVENPKDADVAVVAPDTLGAAFDLGLGPTLLFAVLLVGAVIVAGRRLLWRPHS